MAKKARVSVNPDFRIGAISKRIYGAFMEPIGSIVYGNMYNPKHPTADEQGFIRELQGVIQDRHARMPEGSYTTRLFIHGVKSIAKKVGEECTETLIEAVDGNRDRFVYEASDLVYHLLVLMEQMGCDISDLEKELALRHR